MNLAKNDLDVTRIIMTQRKMTAGLAVLMNGNKEKMDEAKKIFYDRIIVENLEENPKSDNQFLEYLNKQEIDKEHLRGTIFH